MYFIKYLSFIFSNLTYQYLLLSFDYEDTFFEIWIPRLSLFQYISSQLFTWRTFTKKSQKSMCVLTKSTNDLVALEFVFLDTVMVGPNSPSLEECIVDSSCHKWALRPHSSTGAGWRWAPGPVSLHHKANVPPPLRLFSHLGSGSMSVHSSLLCTHWYFYWRWAINIFYCANLAT